MATTPLIAPKPSGNFEIAKEGIVQGVIAEVRNLGMQKETYNGIEKEVHKILLRWQLAEMDAPKDGSKAQPKRLYEKFTFSLHEKAKLRKRVVSIFKKEPPPTFDFNTLVGVNRNLVIEHNVGKDGKTYANIGAIMKLNDGQAKLEIVAIPKKDELKAEIKKSLEITPENPIDDSDIPF